MSVSKVIKFYQFEPQPSLYNNGLVPEPTINLLKKFFLPVTHTSSSLKRKNIPLTY